MIDMVLFGQLLGNFAGFFSGNEQLLLFWYYAFLLAGLVASFALAFKFMKRHLKASSMTLFALLVILTVFLFLELIFVTATHLVYDDELIYAGIAKIIFESHIVGSCDFSTALHCVGGLPGVFQEPGGWPFLISISYAIHGINFGSGYGTTMVLALIGIALVFFITMLLAENENIAVIAAASFAFIPLYMQYARATMPDLPLLVFELLSMLFLLLYLKEKKFIVGVAWVFATAYALSIKVDGAILLVVLLALFMTYRKSAGSNAKWKRRSWVAVIAIGALIVLPSLAFDYNAYATQSFGANTVLGKFGFSYLEGNIGQNLLFWFGAYNNVQLPYLNTSYVYHVEFPLMVTLFAIIGLVYLLYHRKYRIALQLSLWFLIIFLFYSSYYGGGALYSVGDDIRYLFPDFVVMAILSSFGFFWVYRLLCKLVIKIGGRRVANTIKKPIFVVLLLILFSSSAILFITVVARPPSTILGFAGERYDENFITQNYQVVPNGCFVLTLTPQLWYVLNKSNIYLTWANESLYAPTLENLSHGCLYFDRDLSCYVSTRPGTTLNTEAECDYFMQTHVLQPVVVTHYNNFTWNATFGIYKILGNSSS